MELSQMRDFFGYGFIFSYILLLFWFAVLMLAKDFVFRIHGKMFDLQPAELNKIHYIGMAFLKLQAFIFFLVPYLAILCLME